MFDGNAQKGKNTFHNLQRVVTIRWEIAQNNNNKLCNLVVHLHNESVETAYGVLLFRFHSAVVRRNLNKTI